MTKNNKQKSNTGKYTERLSNTVYQGAHESFRMSDDFFQLLIESLEDYAIFTTDTAGSISSWNTGAERILGFKEKDVIGEKASLFFTPEDRRKKQPEKELTTALAKGKARNERWHVRKDGSRFWGVGLVFPLKDETGTIRGLTKIMRDLTRRKRMEDELRMHSQVLESMIEGVSVSDEKGFIIYTNPIEDKLFGYNRGKLIGKHLSIQNTYSPEENKRKVAEVTKQLKKEGIWFGEFSNKKKDGTPFTTFARITAIDMSGKKYWVCVQSDITEQKESQETLKQSEERYRAFIEQSSEGIWRFEFEKPLSTKLSIKKQLTHMFQYAFLAECNDAMAQMYGYKKASEITGARLTDLLVDTEQQNIEYLQSFIKSGYKLSDATSYEKDKNGNIRIFQNNLIGIVEKGVLIRAWGTQREITEQKIVEERESFLKKINDVLVRSFDSDISLRRIAQLIVSFLADYCRIVVLDNGDGIKEIAVNHKDPKKIHLAKDLYEVYKNMKDATHGVPHILQTGKSELIHNLTEKELRTVKDNPKLLQLIKDLGLRSYMGVPLTARGKVIGVLTFSSVRDDRLYTQQDLFFAEEVGRRLALALDNARLYKEAQREIKDRVETEQALKEQQERMELTQTAVKLGTFQWDIATNTMYWSPEMKALYGLSADASIQTYDDWEQFVLPDDRKRLQKEFREQTKTKEILEFEYRIIHTDTTVRWLYSKARVFFNKHKKPSRIVGINMDITDRKHTEQNMRFLAEASKILSSSLDYQTTLNNVAMLAVPEIADWCGIDILNSKGEPQQVAVAHKDPTKVKWAKEYRRQNPPDMSAKTGLANVLKTGKSELYPYISDEMLVAAAKNKKQLKLIRGLGFTSAMTIPLFSQGKPIGAISFVTTETRRRYNEADLAMAEELANRASLAIENAILYKGSQDAIALRDDFISVASHELKTPITSVKIFSQVLQKHSDQIGDVKAKNHLKKMDKQLDKLTELIYNLLDISKIQAGRIQFNEKLFDFDDAIKETTEVLQESTPKHKILIEGQTKKKVYGDVDRIGQVLSNLISNAIKYSPYADKIVIRLLANERDVIVSVTDYGIGMAREHFQRIFERFYRVYDTTDKTFPGLGIGLYISSEIIKRHHGKLWVESNIGKGSTFYFSLPLQRKKAANGIKML